MIFLKIISKMSEKNVQIKEVPSSVAEDKTRFRRFGFLKVREVQAHRVRTEQ